jgi:hypothetical protein
VRYVGIVFDQSVPMIFRRWHFLVHWHFLFLLTYYAAIQLPKPRRIERGLGGSFVRA